MKIAFDAMEEAVIPQFRGGEKETRAKMFFDVQNRIMRGVLISGASIGWHTHETSSEIVYILSGTGKMLYDDTAESLSPGDCHYCPKGHRHSLVNDGSADLVFFAVIPEQ